MVFKIKSPHEKYKSEQSKDRPLQKEGRSGAMLCLPVTPAVCFVAMVENGKFRIQFDDSVWPNNKHEI